jgi:hypothetical protein
LLKFDAWKKQSRNYQCREIYLKGKITDVEDFKIIDTWSLTSESLKDQIIYYFKNYDPLNSVYIMAFQVHGVLVSSSSNSLVWEA